VAKRVLDLLVSAVGLVLFSPVMLILGIWIKLDSKGPVFYRGERVGKDGRSFRMYKFRTMVMEADHIGPAITYREDPRVTNVGKFLRRTKLDELPQLVNVLKGEMSLVGPRPEDPSYVAHYSAQQREVLRVKPGITGLTQLEYRDEASMLEGASADEDYLSQIMPEKLRLDLDYTQDRSLALDIKILWQTAVTLLFRDRSVL
jgi:lipopolysaccharide/colanic/teichoic acid biosynthesis glycosyltransferase